LYYRWSKDFLEAGKKRLSGDTAQMFMTDGETRSWINALW
jgi:transposase